MGDNPPSADDTKVCPYCAETIKKAAIVCRYCGRDLPTDKPAQVESSTTLPIAPSIYGTLEVPVARREIPGQERPEFVAGTPAVPGRSASVLQSYTPPVAKEKKSGCGRIVVAILVIGVLAFAFLWWLLPDPRYSHPLTISVVPDTPATPTLTAGQLSPPTPTMTATQWQRAALSIPCDELARNTEQHIGQLMVMTGTVIQVIDQGDDAELRVMCDDKFSQVLYVLYPAYGKSRVLDADKIKLVATVDGRITYRAVLGNEVTLPSMTARWLEVVKQ